MGSKCPDEALRMRGINLNLCILRMFEDIFFLFDAAYIRNIRTSFLKHSVTCLQVCGWKTSSQFKHTKLEPGKSRKYKQMMMMMMIMMMMSFNDASTYEGHLR